MPLPHWLAVVMRVAISSYLKTAKPKDAEAFMEEMTRTFASEEALSAVLSFRPAAQAEDVARERRKALAWYRQNAPLFLSSLPRKR